MGKKEKEINGKIKKNVFHMKMARRPSADKWEREQKFGAWRLKKEDGGGKAGGWQRCREPNLLPTYGQNFPANHCFN